MRRFALVCPLLLALAACSGDDDPKDGRGSGLGGDGDGLGGDGGAGDGDDEGAGGCEEHIVNPKRVTPDMLIVLDRSGSMIIERPERWSPSKRGVSAIVEELDDVIRFGLMTFPSRAGDDQNAGGQHRNCMPGDVDVAPADNNAGAITGLLNPMQAGGRTPTAVTLQRALAALDEGRAPDQGPIRPKYVMLVTDGSPNCRNNDPNSGNGAGGDPMEVTASVNAISALAEAGIPTYVLGFGTQNNNTLASVLDRMAEAGDTGDTAHRPIEDEASLVREFEQIAGGAVTCDYVLDNKVVDVKYVRVELDGMLLNYNDENGWRLREDARTVTLQGTACETLRGAGDHTFSVVVQCIELF